MRATLHGVAARLPTDDSRRRRLTAFQSSISTLNPGATGTLAVDLSFSATLRGRHADRARAARVRLRRSASARCSSRCSPARPWSTPCSPRTSTASRRARCRPGGRRRTAAAPTSCRGRPARASADHLTARSTSNAADHLNGADGSPATHPLGAAVSARLQRPGDADRTSPSSSTSATTPRTIRPSTSWPTTASSCASPT